MTAPALDRDGPDGLLPSREAERTIFYVCPCGEMLWFGPTVERVVCPRCRVVREIGSD